MENQIPSGAETGSLYKNLDSISTVCTLYIYIRVCLYIHSMTAVVYRSASLFKLKLAPPIETRRAAGKNFVHCADWFLAL